MPLPYIRALSNEVKETKQMFIETEEKMLERKSESLEHYRPVNNLLDSVRDTRVKFHHRAELLFNMIENETEQLLEIQRINNETVEQIRDTIDSIKEKGNEKDNNSVCLVVRSIAAFFPFILYAMLKE